MRGGVYAYRTRKPGAIWGLPFLGRHWGYVGETNSFHHRHLQHTQGGGRYGSVAKPWSDLDPVCVLRIPLPNWKWLRLWVETLLILLLWPVYNVSKNRWNPRRITPHTAVALRHYRDSRTRGFWLFRAWLGLRMFLYLGPVAVLIGWWIHGR